MITDPSNLWPQTLEVLKGKTTKGTFATWLNGTTATLNGTTLTVYVKNSYAQDWLNHRLHSTVSRVVNELAGHDLKIYYEVKSVAAQIELRLEGERTDDYTAIVKPDVIFAGTQYFRQVWGPILGPTLTLIILDLRQRCYRNKRTGEIREHCEATYKDLAFAIGVSENTARRSLRPGPIVNEFILDRKIIRGYSSKVGRIINIITHWTVRLDEPIFDPDKHSSSNGQSDH